MLTHGNQGFSVATDVCLDFLLFRVYIAVENYFSIAHVRHIKTIISKRKGILTEMSFYVVMTALDCISHFHVLQLQSQLQMHFAT